MALIISSWFDFIGVEYGLWYYTGLAIPTIPSYVPWDFCLIPVMIMFFIQIKPDASPLLKAVIFAGISAFAGEAFFQWLGFYQPLHWRSWWSFFIYILLYGVCHMITRLRTFEKL
ncbi:hypothetical protein N6H14_17085 [Paenibacillus sp. CC-CFT747]|nr:hypothetical protein N6H14_17085 [Paenibacillus sp. CC-CFT747]